MAEEGFGICVVPRLAVLKEVDQGRLRLCKTQLNLHNLAFAVAYLKGSDESTKNALATLAIETAQSA